MVDKWKVALWDILNLTDSFIQNNCSTFTQRVSYESNRGVGSVLLGQATKTKCKSLELNILASYEPACVKQKTQIEERSLIVASRCFDEIEQRNDLLYHPYFFI